MAQNQISSEPVVKEVMLDASPSEVWSALTDKDKLKQWCFDMNEFKPEVGFDFHFYGEKDGQ